ncbi:hypothetical protein V6N11_033343 [Hibiscus sabdariffa]|uniref:Uncharacterized protein n=1 Tax=Hibiscus sabdariffa TaxID=183260 RepID=A0ABR2PYF1_9ROSI
MTDEEVGIVQRCVLPTQGLERFACGTSGANGTVKERGWTTQGTSGVGNTGEEEGCSKVIATTPVLDDPHSRNKIEEVSEKIVYDLDMLVHSSWRNALLMLSNRVHGCCIIVVQVVVHARPSFGLFVSHVGFGFVDLFPIVVPGV